MQFKFSRTGTSLALGALFALVGTQASIAQSAPRETSLLGVTLLKSSYRDVLRRFGRPDEIQAGGPFMPSEGAPASRGSGGPAGGGKTTSKSGFLGKGGTGTAGSGSAGKGGGMMQGLGGGMMQGMGGGMMQGKGGGGLPGFDLPAMGGGQGMSGNPMGQDSGMMGGNSGSGMSGQATAGGADSSADQPEYEATWWYHDPMNAFHKSFLFNKDGRVIQIQEYGHDIKHKGSKTSKGVALGSGLNAVLQNYGWSNDGANSGGNMIMRFGSEDKVAFQLVNNKVVGITIAVVKDVAPAEAP